jgi:4-hydroxymandelate oxidase
LPLSLTVSGTLSNAHFAPILVGPASHQGRFNVHGELATAGGASAAKSAMVLADRSDHPVDAVAAQTESGCWYQVYPEDDSTAVIQRVRAAVSAGCKAVCLTVGAPTQPAEGSVYPKLNELTSFSSQAVDWEVVDRIRQATDVPFLLKGVMNPAEASEATDRGVSGIVVSNHGNRFLAGSAEPVEVLPSIAEAVGGRVPLLLDGGIRRGSDVLKALALGATAVFVTRPALWGLAAYGSDGVQTVLEMLQTELGRTMTMIGAVNPQGIQREHVRIHSR